VFVVCLLADWDREDDGNEGEVAPRSVGAILIEVDEIKGGEGDPSTE
jgi:hypothetical protein